MTDYIEKETAKEAILSWAVCINYPELLNKEDTMHCIDFIPTANVAEVMHGRWEFLGPNRLIKDCMCGTCSACHVRSKYIVNIAICPNCGARMDKEGEHDVSE